MPDEPRARDYPTRCDDYPWTVPKRSAVSRFSLAVMGDMPFSEIYGDDLRRVLRKCRWRVKPALADAMQKLTPVEYGELGGQDTRKAGDGVMLYEQAMDDMAKLIPTGMSMLDLAGTPNHAWPGGLHAAFVTLHGLGFTLTVHLIPDAEKAAIREFADPAGGNFLARVAGLSWRDFFCLPMDGFSGDERDAMFWGRRYGIMLCHPSLPRMTMDALRSVPTSMSNPILEHFYLSPRANGMDTNATRVRLETPDECINTNGTCGTGNDICASGGSPCA